MMAHDGNKIKFHPLKLSSRWVIGELHAPAALTRRIYPMNTKPGGLYSKYGHCREEGNLSFCRESNPIR
jgi:hypothetical protein